MSYPATSDLSQYLREIQKYPVLTPEEEQRLAIRWYDDGDVEAARQLVLGNLRFALKIALEYARYGPVADLVQEANLGLMEAVRRFNPYRGYRLITYAVWWIRAYVQRYLVESSSIVRRGTTRDQRRAARQLTRTRRALEQETGGEVSAQQIAEAMDVSEQAVAALMNGSDVSLDAPVGADGDSATLLDFLADQQQDPEAAVAEEQELDFVQRALEDVRKELNERERAILDARILSTDPATLQELADEFSVSRERIRQIESGVRKKVQQQVERMLGPGDRKALPAGS
ncbi:MAG: sigma-70 family RNA polymerase sigma factor [Candidatus Dadabacteria bacterium]|nr:MAG: sigma-70 family RNA polymerase sigma factor [Candidatus Dadabacteria bacterium]